MTASLVEQLSKSRMVLEYAGKDRLHILFQISAHPLLITEIVPRGL
jgi:hypothetical protein